MRPLILPLTTLALAAQAPSFTARDAVQAEWSRRAPALAAAQLPAADRARYELSLARIGAPGAPELLPPELAHPTKDAWETLAKQAKTPQERFTALFFLNRFKAPDALAVLDGLTAEDAKTWPKHLHLEAQIATARINGGEVAASLQGFLDSLKKAGKVDPVRAQAAQLRLVMAGKEKELLAAITDTPRSEMTMIDAWNQEKWFDRKPLTLQLLGQLSDSCPEPVANDDFNKIWGPLGIHRVGQSDYWPNNAGTFVHLMEGIGRTPDSAITWDALDAPEVLIEGNDESVKLAFLANLSKFEGARATEFGTQFLKTHQHDYMALSSLLPSLRKLAPEAADALRAKLLAGPSAIARAAAIDDLPAAPADLDALAKRCFDDTDLESALELFSALDRWKLPPEQQKAVLTPFLRHPDWGWRYQAWLQLRKTDPAAPWPAAPAERPLDKALLAEATRLAKRGKPVRLRITFSGRRIVTLKLDPEVAPMNVANLVLLARKRFFDGHRVPRVVPDFVVQMGSPLDTMDGGPGYSVRCEDSMVWYGPGSVGMALAGKDTGGCQFFITTNATPHLTGKYTRLGEVENPDHDLKILDDLELGAKIESIRVLD